MKDWEEIARKEMDAELEKQTHPYRQWIRDNEPAQSSGDMKLMDVFALQ